MTIDDAYERKTDRIHDDLSMCITPCHLCRKFQSLEYCVGTPLDEKLVFCSTECAEAWEKENALDYLEVQEKPKTKEEENKKDG